jgi:hypothetical protein
VSRIIVKAARDLDLYVGWSTNVDAPVWWGTRADILAYMCSQEARDDPGEDHTDPVPRLARADEHGTSAVGGYAFFGRWDDEYLVYEQRGLLPRGRLAEVCAALEKDDEAAVWDMLEPIADDMPVIRD